VPPRLACVSVRDQIISSALELCAKRGITATSLQDIADAAQCSKANVLYHFSHKEDLIGKALEPSLAATEELVSKARARGLGTDHDRLVFVEELVDLLIKHGLATHLVITHPYLVDSVPALAKAQELMASLADVVETKTSSEADRLRFGIAVSGVTYSLVFENLLNLPGTEQNSLKALLGDVLTSMVISSPTRDA
jgi:AcrR family transcriptional regulator